MKEANWDEIFDGKSKVKIVFEQKDVEEVLELVGNKISDKNIVTDEKGSPEISYDESQINRNELGAIETGSKIFLRNNIASFSEYLFNKNR